MVRELREKLDEQKAAMKACSLELQLKEVEKREREKEKVEWVLAVKELEHKIAKFHKDGMVAASKVREVALRRGAVGAFAPLYR